MAAGEGQRGDIGFRARLWELPAPCSVVFLQVTQPEHPRTEAALIVMIILINETGELGLKEKPFRSTFDFNWCLVGRHPGQPWVPVPACPLPGRRDCSFRIAHPERVLGAVAMQEQNRFSFECSRIRW